MTISAQIARLDRNVGELAVAVASVGEKLFLERLNGWSVRDIVAHLIGWNRSIIEGSRQIVRGELPFYDRDPGEDYSKVNAKLIREYPSTDRDELLEELRFSARELGRFLETLDAETWRRDFGVRHQDSIVTICNSVEELIDDYDHHRHQIDEWVRRKATPPATAFFLGVALVLLLGCGPGVSEADRPCRQACEVIFECGWNIGGSEKECLQACKEEDNVGFVDCMSALQGCDPNAGKTCLEMLD